MERRAQDLANRLVGTLSNQFVLVPCNVDEHWILTVIDPHKEEIGILDPFYSGIHDSTWKKVIEWALKMFNATMQRKGRKTLNWSIPKVPKQPDNSQCGFYVMRYMKDIIESANFERISSLQLLVRNYYNYILLNIFDGLSYSYDAYLLLYRSIAKVILVWRLMKCGGSGLIVFCR
ncbi:uncharacterized protein LOC131011392 isoform X1 [Salvia miltiorrhiza]|uniref:uncharacterized protein LOC131011392 isoform X1 n=1 Tax=Salvia miltiorrhiza TaxID=226208 RepID=UPI0025AD3FDB|nr:uncharacterized protein LOC131011392 isoform X1 [Salvia miltiorrhiza]